tara:strand:- start:1470 stop:1676 length:207 start_codon:yes stop_codon:yes gene_type:complete
MNQLKTKEEMNDMDMNELRNYCDDLYQLWNQATKIRDYRRTMNDTTILLNDTSVIDIKELPENIGEEE